MPFLSERMRKRRAFADKELNAIMFERERHLAVEKTQLPGLTLPDGSLAHTLASGLTPQDFLARTFPQLNASVLELIYQACGCDLQKTVEKIVLNSSFNSTGCPVGKLLGADQQHWYHQLLLSGRVFYPLLPAVATCRDTGDGVIAGEPSKALQHDRSSSMLSEILQERSAFTAVRSTPGGVTETVHCLTEGITDEPKLRNRSWLSFSVESIIGKK